MNWPKVWGLKVLPPDGAWVTEATCPAAGGAGRKGGYFHNGVFLSFSFSQTLDGALCKAFKLKSNENVRVHYRLHIYPRVGTTGF